MMRVAFSRSDQPECQYFHISHFLNPCLAVLPVGELIVEIAFFFMLAGSFAFYLDGLCFTRRAFTHVRK